MIKPALFVGEANPYGGSPENALLDFPETSSGARLRVALGMSSDQYRASPLIRRTNLCLQVWELKTARSRAREILLDARQYRAIVLLGTKVRLIFGFPRGEPVHVQECAGLPFILLPHPSGRNPAWNRELANTQKALREVLPELWPESVQ